MTSIAQEKLPTASAAPVERAVFVTDDDRRSRIARRLALAALAVATLWLAALAIGMLGLGQLPGVSLPLPAGSGGKAKQHAPQPASQPLVRSASIDAAVPAAVRPDRNAVVRASTATSTTTRSARAKAQSSVPARAAAAPARGRTPVTATAPPPAPAATSPRVARGLERRGLTAPPGRTQKASAATKTPQGQTTTPQGQVKRADATQPAPLPPPAPGQQKPDKPPAKA
jgi:hypothetical protein